ncbi:MAG: YbhB/YbcL family Raf kinase inhibitor-like protein [Patescibacteria group bacterium]|nr:YbhB/YbcL family Raf kinase inhibitor-like protein [Patescibacteria group bacterium]
MLIESIFKNGESIPAKYTCDGENVNPPLKFFDVPKNAKSLALIFDDPDSPSGTWTHWTVWNINPKLLEIKENSIPENAVLGKTTFGEVGYGGPCPGSGEHRYVFKLFALDIVLNLKEGTDINQLEQAINEHVIEKCELIGKYQRS